MQDDTFQAILALGDTVLVSNGKDHRKCKILRWKWRSVQCNELDALIIHPPQKSYVMCDTLECCYSATVSTMRCNWMPCIIMGIKLGDTVYQKKCKMIHLTRCNELGDTQ